jgi:hypothetical protein
MAQLIIAYISVLRKGINKPVKQALLSVLRKGINKHVKQALLLERMD